jgi:hypothetical protein
MEALVNLKRTAPAYYEHCIICQAVKSDTSFHSSEQGLATLREATYSRHKLSD